MWPVSSFFLPALVVIACSVFSSSWAQSLIGADADQGGIYRVPIYHFKMLNDDLRNEAYYAMLRKVITNESVVYDLGAGSGLLSCMAAKLGARRVFAVERKGFCEDVLRQVIEDNGFGSTVRVICADSASLVAADFAVSNPQPPQGAHVLLSETLDAYVIGEGFLTALDDWRIRKVVPSTALVIPSHASLHMRLAESTYLLNASATVSGFDFSSLRPFQPRGEVIVGPWDDNLLRALSDSRKIFDIDFAAVFRGDLATFQFAYLEMAVTQTGLCSTLVLTFECSLDAAGSIAFNTHPGTKTHWGQMTYLLNWDAQVAAGDVLRLQMAQMPERIVVANAGAGGRIVRFTQKGKEAVQVFASREGEDYCDTDPEAMLFEIGDSFGEFNLAIGHVGQVFTLIYLSPKPRQKTFVIEATRGEEEMIEYHVL